MIARPDETHDPARSSWAPGADEHADFPIQNLPFGIASGAGRPSARPVVAIGDQVLDLCGLAATLGGPAPAGAFETSVLNDVFASPAAERLALRHWLSGLLSDRGHQARVASHLYPQSAVDLHLPARIGDYTDFYVGIRHATNVGSMLRPENPLMPNYKHIPIGYHGRASSIRVSGEPVIRPYGQTRPVDGPPIFGASARMDYELELGVWIGQGNRLGQPIPIAEAGQHVAGLSLLNDWSARDIQTWEYQPLGPFLGKSFQTTISPWVVTAEALAPFRIAQPARAEGDPEVLPYLRDADDEAYGAFALDLEVALRTAAMRARGLAPMVIGRTAARHMYWTVGQMIAHHTSNGCNLQPGDLLGTGTISGNTRAALGSLFEVTRGGQTPLEIEGGETRGFLEDGDEVLMTARASAEGRRSIGFGVCAATVESALTAA